MTEAGDYDPGYWKGHDFKSARGHYDRYAGRSYADAVSAGKDLADVLPVHLSSDSASPLTIVCDVTGSMGEWPAVMFSKLPYLELEGQEYLGEDMEICFAAVGDAYAGDKYPLQARPFTKGLDLKAKLEELVIEGGGGGQTTENYELAALYFARNVSLPNAIRPILIFIGDEAPYDFVDRVHAKNYAHVNLEGRLATKEIFEELKRKYAVYLIRKPYDISGTNRVSSTDERIHRQWRELLGDDHIADLPDAGRVVDVIFGILASETGRIEYFKEELEGRQLPGQVKVVYKSLTSVHRLDKGGSQKKLPSGHSETRDRDKDAPRSKPLL